MAEAFYRLKSAGGDWTRVTGTAPITVTGLTEGATYEYLKGDGTIGEVTAGGAATVVPSLTASGSLSGRDLTISVDSLTGDPSPSVALTSLTLDALSVLGNEVGSDPWVYTVPDSESAQTVAWTLEANNAGGTDTASGSEAVPANLFAPTASTAPTISGTVAPGETVTLNEGTYTGNTPITIAFTLTLDGVDVTADVASNNYTIPAGTDGQSLVYTETASNGTSPDATQSVTETVTGTLTLPTFQPGQVYTPDPAGAFVIASDEVGVTPLVSGTCAYTKILDVTGMPEFDGVTNSAGDRLNRIMVGSTDHGDGKIYAYLNFGLLTTGWKTYETALADGDLSTYGGTTPAVTSNIFYETASTPETPILWKNGSTWYLITHEPTGASGSDQLTRYATSSSAFGPWIDQGTFLTQHESTDHNGYARFTVIPAGANVSGPNYSAAPGDLLMTTLNSSLSATSPSHAIHAVSPDFSGSQFITQTPHWRRGTFPAGMPVANEDMLITQIQEFGPLMNGEMPVLALTRNETPGLFSSSIVETALADDLVTITREPKIVLSPQEIDTDGLTGVEDLTTPNIVTDVDGQTYMVVTARSADRSKISVVAMPVTLDYSANSEPRVFDDHKFEEIDFSNIATLGDIAAPWSIVRRSGTPNATLDGDRLLLNEDTALAHDGFETSQTEWVQVWADGMDADQTDIGVNTWAAYAIAGDKGDFGSPLGALIHRRNAPPEVVWESGAGTERDTLQPEYGILENNPGGWEWDLTANTARPLHGNYTHTQTYDLNTDHINALTGRRMYPAFWRFLDNDLAHPSAVGKVIVRTRGPGHTPNAAPSVASAATDAAGTKVTVTLDRPCLGTVGFVVVVGNTVINTTPDRVDATTIDLVRDSGTFTASDDVRLYHQTGGDIRSNPEWVMLPEITDALVTNNVT